MLLDRRTERAAIDRVLDAVRSGFCGTLVLRGGPGVGKSTLLEYAVAAAPDLRVSGIVGVESEISMEFAGLHQLLVPFLPRLDDLPPPQRGALRVAFGQEAGPPPERFLVGQATLTLPRGRSPPCRSRWLSTRCRNPWPATSATPTPGGP